MFSQMCSNSCASRYDAYAKAAEQFAITQATLLDKRTAAQEIDRVITACITSARPVYLFIPTDVVFMKIPTGNLHTPLTPSNPPNDEETEQFVLDEIVKKVEQAEGDAIFLVDACAVRHHVKDEVKELVEKTGFPVYAAPMGKSAVWEGYERYGGVSISLFVFSVLCSSLYEDFSLTLFFS